MNQRGAPQHKPCIDLHDKVHNDSVRGLFYKGHIVGRPENCAWGPFLMPGSRDALSIKRES